VALIATPDLHVRQEPHISFTTVLTATAFCSLSCHISTVKMDLNHSVLAGQSHQQGDLFGRANQIAHEAIQALRTVHSYNLQSQITSRYEALLASANRTATRNALISGVMFGAASFSQFGMYGLGFWYGGERAAAGEMTLKETLIVLFTILLSMMGMSETQMAFPDVAKGSKAVARIFRGAARSD
jgi:ABC-type multidrug transport system fused ATPase/permease subunit